LPPTDIMLPSPCNDGQACVATPSVEIQIRFSQSSESEFEKRIVHTKHHIPSQQAATTTLTMASFASTTTTSRVLLAFGNLFNCIGSLYKRLSSKGIREYRHVGMRQTVCPQEQRPFVCRFLLELNFLRTSRYVCSSVDRVKTVTSLIESIVPIRAFIIPLVSTLALPSPLEQHRLSMFWKSPLQAAMQGNERNRHLSSSSYDKSPCCRGGVTALKMIYHGRDGSFRGYLPWTGWKLFGEQ
jgi:hypothetical protein